MRRPGDRDPAAAGDGATRRRRGARGHHRLALGAVAALAYLHRSAWTVGDEVTVEGRRATVVELPAASGQW